MYCSLPFIIFSTIFICLVSTQESVHYLQTAIKELKNMKTKFNSGRMVRRDSVLDSIGQAANHFQEQTTNNIHRRPNTENVQKKKDGQKIPPLSFTKGELSAIYEAALSQGNTVNFDTGEDMVAAVVHELSDSEPSTTANVHNKKYQKNPNDDVAGYYYYYYPIKSFIDELTSQPHVDQVPQPTLSHIHPHSKQTTVKPQYQYHSHAHQHTVNITALKTILDGEKKPTKALEPLFMAISGFIGMAVMFVISVLFLPKFGLATKKSVKKNDKFGDVARIALRAIEKQDCTERLACELGKTARAFNLGNNRFVKLLKRLAPGTFGKHMEIVEDYSNKRIRCTAIPCKKKGGPKLKPNTKTKKKT